MAASITIPTWSCEPTKDSMNAKFKVLKDGSHLDPIKLNKRNMVFGRKSDLCNVTLDHHTISRRHAMLVHKEDSSIHIMDLGSAQGTTINGEPLPANKPLQLNDKDRIQFGQSTRVYIMDYTVPKKMSVQESDSIRDQLPTGFGSKSNTSSKQSDRDRREAEIAMMTKSMAMPIETTRKRVQSDEEVSTIQETQLSADREQRGGGRGGEGSGERKEEMSPEERGRSMGLPISHEITLVGHDKAVLAVALDPAGGRVVGGGLDQKLLLWDFGGMDKSHRAFRELEPQSGYSVVALSFSPSGDRFLCCPTSVHPAVFTKEGAEIIRFVRGDMYLADASHTKGHTHPVTGGSWHPMERDQVLTCSSDSTLRIWDLNGKTALEGRLICRDIYKIKNQRGVRVGATACTYEPDGEQIAGGGVDGSVQLWKIGQGAGASGRPDTVIRTAHTGEVTGLAYSANGRMLASRGDDDTVKVWDIRKTASPLQVFGGCDSFFPTSNVTWSPDSKVVCCGTSVRKGQGVGTAKFFNVESGELMFDVGVAEGASVVTVNWHPELNQVVCSTSNGAVKLLYDPLLSRNGALLSSTRTVRRAMTSIANVDSTNALGTGVIINPCALPMYQDERYKKRPRGEDPVRPGELRKPDSGPKSGPEANSLVVSASRKHFTDTILSGRMKHHNLKDQDSRAELIKYADKVSTSQFTGAAYVGNKNILAERTLEQEKDDAEKEEKRKIGLGIQ